MFILGDYMKQHKWHKEIKAWADGEEIEFKVDGKGEWTLLKGNPYWECKNDLFRIKPHELINGLTEEETNNTMSVKGLSKPKEPKYLYVYEGEGSYVGLYKDRLVGLSGKGYVGKIKLEDDE